MRYILPAKVSDANLAASTNSAAISGELRQGSLLLLEVTGTLGTGGAVRVSARVAGGPGAFGVTFLPITNVSSGATIAAGTGITAPGLYSVDLTGLEVRVEFTAGTGATNVNVIGELIRK